MSFKGFFTTLFSSLANVENQMKYSFRFSQSELNEILQSAKAENVKFLQEISKISKLSAFEVSYLLSSAVLDEEKVEIVKAAVDMYDEEEFLSIGQTLSDFIFRVSANIDSLNASNLGLFKELVQCRNEIYDFKDALKNPQRPLRARKKELSFAFEKVLV
ncbi:hypothetical protein tpqmel_0514 [Candidatus Gastranaerophilus sp. (ex Termes propinquus)]|nr:hypothetical protein tpqmel_0514 [Candidatus Gastranaerophilus sp. (ex Termes propinquus)]